MIISEDQLKEIAAKTSLGMKAFVNKDIGKIYLILDPDSPYTSEEFISDELNEIYYKWSSYFEINPISDKAEFQFISKYAESLDDKKLKSEVQQILNNKKAYENFYIKLKESASIIDWEDHLPIMEYNYTKNLFLKEGISEFDNNESDFIIFY